MKTHTTLERVYNDMLGVLPPQAMAHGDNGVSGFLVGEPSDHKEGVPVYQSYFKSGANYVAGPVMTVSEFKKAVNMYWSEIAEGEETPDDIAEEMRLIEDHGQEAVDAYHKLGIEQNHGLENFEEAYVGRFDSPEDFARDLFEQTKEKDIPDGWPFRCIDWEWAAREIMYDFSEQDGYYFRNL